MIHIPIAICPVRPGQRWWHRQHTTYWIRITRAECPEGDWRVFFTTQSNPRGEWRCPYDRSFSLPLSYILEAT